MTLVVHRFPIRLTSILLSMFVVGILAGALLRDGSSFRTGWIESYLKMHSSLTRAVIDDRLLVMHTDLAALEQLADREATVIRVNPSNFSNIAYVVVDAADTSALDLIRDLPSVQLVIRNRVVLFCH
ncbi:MAG: hypothetical protein VX559_15780 [Pseudomonadota bacterium]|nr:hypothetical protein [Pseudomonadota bacterium]